MSEEGKQEKMLDVPQYITQSHLAALLDYYLKFDIKHFWGWFREQKKEYVIARVELGFIGDKPNIVDLECVGIYDLFTYLETFWNDPTAKRQHTHTLRGPEVKEAILDTKITDAELEHIYRNYPYESEVKESEGDSNVVSPTADEEDERRRRWVERDTDEGKVLRFLRDNDREEGWKVSVIGETLDMNRNSLRQYIDFHYRHTKILERVRTGYYRFKPTQIPMPNVSDTPPLSAIKKEDTILTPEKKQALEEVVEKFIDDTDEYVPSFLYEDKNLSKEYSASKKLLRKRFQEILTGGD